MKVDHTAMDAQILAVLRQGPTTFDQLCTALKIDKRDMRSVKPPWRYLDNRLQALRKAGTIVFKQAKNEVKPAWRLP